MNLKTNFNPSHEAKFKSLIGKKLVSIIFFQTKPSFAGGYYPSNGRFPSKERIFGPFAFGGERLALVFEMSDSMVKSQGKRMCYEVLSIRNNYKFPDTIFTKVTGYRGIDFHFEQFTRENNYYPIPEKIDEIELIELANPGINSKIITPHISFLNIDESVRKVELFGMKESILRKEDCKLENVSRWKFDSYTESLSKYDYPININIIDTMIISLSSCYLFFEGLNAYEEDPNDFVTLYSFDEQKVEERYKEMKKRKTEFNHLYKKLLYTIEI